MLLIDPLLTAETVRAALNLYCQQRPRKPVRAVVRTPARAPPEGDARQALARPRYQRVG